MRGFSIRGFSRAFVTLGLFAVMPAGCSIFGGDDGDPAPGGDLADLPNGSSPDGGATPPSSDIVVAGNPDDSELNEQFGVFVSARGSDSGNGTRAAPLATLAAGVRLAKQFGRRVYACAGTYKENVVMEDGAPMLGGIDCSSGWKFSSTMRARIEAPSSPAVVAKGITTATRLDGFEIIAPDAVRVSENSMAVFAVNSVGLTIAHSRLQAGRGGDGTNGAAAIALIPTGNPNGADGEAPLRCGAGQCTTASTIAAGGNGACAGAPGHDGFAGGNGGRGGTYDITIQGVWTPVSYGKKIGMLTLFFDDVTTDGLSGEGPGGAAGTQNAHSQNGAAGLAGKDGHSGSSYGYVLAEDGLMVANGTRGTDGEPGKGGGGEAGAASGLPQLTGGRTRGWGGPGGGAGGCPGLAGEAGTGGGASIALAAYESPVRVEACEIVTSNGGNGGQGTLPSVPTAGGIGGLVSGLTQRAGHGGAGGRAGISGHGAGGPSVGIGWAGTEPVVTDTTYKIGPGGAGAPAKTGGGVTIPASESGVTAEKKLLVIPA